MASLFTKIQTGKIPGFVIAEDDNFFAILDRYPTQPGHTLVIPKEEYATVFDLPKDLYTGLFEFARKLAPVLMKVTEANRINVQVEGVHIKDHCHVHLIPVQTDGPLKAESKEASDEELEKWQKKILQALSQK